MLLINRAALVYQSGIANVFAVDSLFGAPATERKVRRLYQGDFNSAARMAYGMALAGTDVMTFSCNVAGDCAHAEWTLGTDATPFREHAMIVSGRTISHTEVNS